MATDDQSTDTSQNAGDTANSMRGVSAGGDVNIHSEYNQEVRVGNETEVPDRKGENNAIDFFEWVANLSYHSERVISLLGGIGGAGSVGVIIWFYSIVGVASMSTGQWQLFFLFMLLFGSPLFFAASFWGTKYRSTCPDCSESWAVRTTNVKKKGRTETAEGADAVHLERFRECGNCGYSDTKHEDWSSREFAT